MASITKVVARKVVRPPTHTKHNEACLASAEDLVRIEKALKRFLILSDAEKSRLAFKHRLGRLVLDIEEIPVSDENPMRPEDPIYGYIAEPVPKTKYRPNKRARYYLNHLHHDVIRLREKQWTFARIEEHFRTEKKVPYRFTKEQLWRLHRKFTKS